MGQHPRQAPKRLHSYKERQEGNNRARSTSELDPQQRHAAVCTVSCVEFGELLKGKRVGSSRPTTPLWGIYPPFFRQVASCSLIGFQESGKQKMTSSELRRVKPSMQS